MLFLCICIFRYSFYNCALVYCTRDGAIFSIHSFQGFFQTPKQGWANMDSIPFLYLYTNRHEFVELYWQKKMIEVNMKKLLLLFMFELTLLFGLW